MRLGPLLLLLLLVACAGNPQRDQALERAKQARARGDYVGEALALRDACNFAPDDKKLCSHADQAFAAAQAISRESGRRACTNIAPTLVGVDACLAAVGEIRKLTPGDPDIGPLAEAAARQHLARCMADSPAWQTDLDAAVELIRCEQAREAQIGLQTYSQQVAAARGAARDQLLALADHPSYATKYGAQTNLVAAAACLTATPDLVNRTTTSWRTFIDKARGTIDLRVSSNTPLPDVCNTAAGMLADRAACNGTRAGAPTITIGGEVQLGPVDHNVFETQESKDYVAGIIRFNNPDYQPAVNDERSARESKDRAEQQFRRDESDCRSAESALSSAQSCSSCSERTERDRACNAKSSSESMYRSRTRDWEEARRHLDNTPQIKEREDIRTAHYILKHHSWRVAWQGQLKNEGEARPAAGGTQTDDLETMGAPVAGVPADPVTYPSSRWFIGPIRDQLATQVAQTVDAALKRRASDLAVACPAPLAWNAEWLDCWSKVRLWAGAPWGADALLRAVGDTRDARRSKLWDHVRCER